MSRNALRAALLAATLAFAILAVLVAVGALTRIDDYGLDHLGAGGVPVESEIPLLGRLFQYHGDSLDASQVVRLPGTVAASVLLLLLGCAILWRRGDRKAVLLWGGAFIAANVVVIACKETIAKPALYGLYNTEPVKLSEFDMSFPSGHTMRIALLAALFAYVWHWLRWPLLACVVVAVATIEIDHLHTLSDIVGGLLLGASAILSVALALEAARAGAESPNQSSADLPSAAPQDSVLQRGSAEL